MGGWLSEGRGSGRNPGHEFFSSSVRLGGLLLSRYPDGEAENVTTRSAALNGVFRPDVSTEGDNADGDADNGESYLPDWPDSFIGRQLRADPYSDVGPATT